MMRRMNQRNFTLVFNAALVAVASLCGTAAAQVHGALEFSSNGTFTAPSKVKQVQVELWGSGGNGGTGDTVFAGGGGGAGGYARAWVSVKNGQTYQVHVGSATGTGAARGSWFADPAGVQLVAASGGSNGKSSSAGSQGGGGGTGSGASALVRTGSPGSNGGPAIPGIGGLPIQAGVPLPTGVSTGGNGSIAGGQTGGRGHVIITW
jgi:hypothetical protein